MIKRILDRRFFVMCFISCLVLMFLFAGKIWEINIEGNVRNTDMQILEYLYNQGIFHGISKKKVHCAEIAASLRKKYPDIIWVSAKIDGICLQLEVRENSKIAEEAPKKKVSNIVSRYDGKIINMITRAGIPKKGIGDECKKGEILVEGIIPYLNDSQEIIGYKYVDADADIFIERKVHYYDSFFMEYMAQEIIGDPVEKYYLIFDNKWQFGYIFQKKNPGITICQIEDYNLTKSLKFPFKLGKITQWNIKKTKQQYSKKEAAAIATKHLLKYEEKLLEKGVQILENNVKININYAKCEAQGSLTLIEECTEKTPVKQQLQEIERTSEDG